jgi:hypothetical protein
MEYDDEYPVKHFWDLTELQSATANGILQLFAII